MPEPEAARNTVPPKSFRDFAARHPEVVEAYERFGAAVRDAGPLSAREVALVKLAVSVGARLEGSAHAHARKALALGLAPEELEHLVVLSAPTIGFPSMVAALKWVRAEADRSGG
jgi:alkylhydroperoxidase/carboxymuconolactone decarboxylase family protein YurZ